MCFTLTSRQQQEQSCQDKHVHIKRLIEHMMSARLLTLNTHTHTRAHTQNEQMPKELLLWEKNIRRLSFVLFRYYVQTGKVRIILKIMFDQGYRGREGD